ncbi:MAG: glycosyltransferase [Hyphomonadaceae bacterium]
MGLGGAERLEPRRREAAHVSDKALEAARIGFARAHPKRSAHRVLWFTQAICGLVLIAAFVWAARTMPGPTFLATHAAALILFAIIVAWRLIAAANLSPILWRLSTSAAPPVYTILCPLYREANMVADLIHALCELDYPTDRLDIKLLIESDDQETLAAAAEAADAPWMEIVAIPARAPRTKPKALNLGLAFARGDFVAIYDAEDRPHPQQLRAALAAFEDGGETLACVQAPLVIDNPDASWIARQFAAEYAIQFREILPLLARLGLPLPLGGSSNHFRTQILRQVGGWDPFKQSEDRANFANKLNRFRTSAFHIPFVSQSCASAE